MSICGLDPGPTPPNVVPSLVAATAGLALMTLLGGCGRRRVGFGG